jgi:hypothetical protein
MDIFSEEYLSIMKLIKDKISMSFTPQNLILKGDSNVQAEQRKNQSFRF